MTAVPRWQYDEGSGCWRECSEEADFRSTPRNTTQAFRRLIYAQRNEHGLLRLFLFIPPNMEYNIFSRLGQSPPTGGQGNLN
jgi:hypothetical protein